MGFLHQKDTVEFDLTSDKDTDLEVTDINIPPFVKLNDFQYGGGITQRYKIKNTKLKTKNKSSIRLLTVEFPQTLLIKLYSLMTPPEGLLPSKLGVWEGTVAKLAMRQPFVLFKGLTFQKLCLP
ncbi:hypothetical protein ABTF59_18555, partial [Acinetobacter baumannii]